MKYCSKITGWGPDALFFLEDPDAQFMIIFNEDAPPELAEISVLHTKSGIYTEPENGDTVLLGDKVFEVTAVGEEARHTLRDLGHCTLCFKGGILLIVQAASCWREMNRCRRKTFRQE